MMMMHSNPFEDELDAIRIRHYEQTKDMTRAERVAYVNNRAVEILKTYETQAAHADTPRQAR